MVSRVSVGGLKDLGIGCEWLAGLVWEELGGQGLGCVGFVYKIVEITAASSNNSGGRVLGLVCVEWNAVHFDFFFPVEYFSKFWQFAFAS